MELWATVGSEAGSKLASLGLQFALLGSVALCLGGLRLWVARPSPSGRLLALGLLLFAVGFSAECLSRLELVEISYYPGWKEEMEIIFMEEDPDLEFSDEDIEVAMEPRGWEGIYWWGERLLRLAGMGLGTAGFVLGGRALLRGGPGPRPKAKPKAKAKRTRTARG